MISEAADDRRPNVILINCDDLGMATWVATMAPLPLIIDREVIEQQPEQASLTERYLVEAQRRLSSRSFPLG